MTAALSRRAVMGALAAGLSPAAAFAADAAIARIRGLETSLGCRIGISARDTGSGRTLAYRADERFAMCSTFKLALAAQALAAVERGTLRLDQRVPFGAADLIGHAPISRARVGDGALTVEDLCAAAVSQSDNTAANLLLRRLGGPPGLTAFMRRLGDRTTRLDRMEMALNENRPGDPRDTTTPAAMRGAMEAFLLGKALAPASQARLVGWMVKADSGLARLRAGLPAGWRAGDKTGTANGAVNDLAIAWPPGRAPIVIAAYTTGPPGAEAGRETALAEVGRIVTAAFG